MTSCTDPCDVLGKAQVCKLTEHTIARVPGHCKKLHDSSVEASDGSSRMSSDPTGKVEANTYNYVC